MPASDKNEEWTCVSPTQSDEAVQTYVRRWKVYASVIFKSEAATLEDFGPQASGNG